MRKALLVKISLMCLLVAFDATSEGQPARLKDTLTGKVDLNRCAIENTAFQGGEEFTFAMYYNWKFVWMAAGEVTFRVKDLGDTYHISAYGSTYKSYDVFYKVRDQYDVYMDKATMLPIRSIRNVEEGNYRLYDELTFDHKRGQVRSLRGKTKETAEVTVYPIENCMHDILSIIYFARNLDFNHMQEGDQFPIKIFIDKETWPLAVKYLGKDKKRVRGQGRFDTVVFSPEVIKGYIFNESDMKVWVTDDANRLPLLIESPLTVGSVKAVLKEYKGLRHEFTARR